jgi:hypothetical protein
VHAALDQQERQAVLAKGRAEIDSLMKHGRYDEAIVHMQQLISPSGGSRIQLGSACERSLRRPRTSSCVIGKC